MESFKSTHGQQRWTMPRVWGIVDFYLTVAQPGIAANTSKERHEPGALVLVYTHRHTHAQKHGQTKPSRQSQTPATRMPMTQLQELPVYTHTHTLSSKPRLGHPGSLSSSPPPPPQTQALGPPLQGRPLRHPGGSGHARPHGPSRSHAGSRQRPA